MQRPHLSHLIILSACLIWGKVSLIAKHSYPSCKKEGTLSLSLNSLIAGVNSFQLVSMCRYRPFLGNV